MIISLVKHKHTWLILLSFFIANSAFSQFPSFKTYYKTFYELSEHERAIIAKVYPRFKHEKYLSSGYAAKLALGASDTLNLIKTERENLAKDKSIDPTTNQKYIDIDRRYDDVFECRRLLSAINKLTGSPKPFFNMFAPVINNTDARLFFEGIQDGNVTIGNSINIQGSEDRGVVNTDIVSGYIGAVRISFNTVFLATKDTSTKLNTAEKVFNGGGLTTINFAWPWLYFQRSYFLLVSKLTPKFVGDFPIFGNDIDRKDFVGYADIGNELYVQVNEKTNKFNFFANFKAARIIGTNNFYRNIESKGSESFWIGQVYAGVKVSNSFAIGANIPLFTSNNVTQPKSFSIGFTLFPSLSEKLKK